MTIMLNNRSEVFDDEPLSIARMLELKRYTFRLKIVKVNGKLISKDKYDSTYITEGDNVQMLYLMSGG